MIAVSLVRAVGMPSLTPFAQHLFGACRLLDWITALPSEVVPTPRPGNEDVAAAKAPLRAGYLGHVTLIANKIQEAAALHVRPPVPVDIAALELQ